MWRYKKLPAQTLIGTMVFGDHAYGCKAKLKETLTAGGGGGRCTNTPKWIPELVAPSLAIHNNISINRALASRFQ